VNVSDFITLVGGTGGGVGLVMLYLFITGYIVPKGRIEEKDKEMGLLRAERDEWKRAWELERARGDVQVQASYVIKEIAQGIRREARETT